ncbi:TetR/AcrR family transcriptional regulator [Burkholderia sp. 3C]
MRTRNNVETHSTYEELLNAAEALFVVKGVSGVSLETIAKEAGMTRGAIYWHFDSKDSILEALYDRAFEDLSTQVEVFENTLASSADLNAIRAFCFGLVDFPLRDRHCMRVIALLLAGSEMTRGNVLFFRFQSFCQRVIDAIERALRSAAAKGEIARSLDSHLAALHLHAHITGTLSVFLVGKIDIPANATVGEMMRSSIGLCIESLAHADRF